MKKAFIAHVALICGVTLGITGGLLAEEPKKPVGIWKFEEDAGKEIKDSSGNGNDGYITRPELQDIDRVAGRKGKGLEFKGNPKEGGTIVIPGMSKKYDHFKNGITIEVWVKFRETIDKGKQYEIVSNTESDFGKGLRLKFHNEWLYFLSGDGTKAWGTHQDQLKYPVKGDVWYFLAAVYDGSTFKLYIDGELAASGTSGLLSPGLADIYIGSYKNGYAYRFDGFIDEVKIYDYARTDAQILGDARAE